jgi:hypothetical protein
LEQFAGGGGRKDWFLVRSRADLDLVLGKGKPSDCYTIFLQPQLPHRGRANADLRSLALALLVGEAEYLFGVISDDVNLTECFTGYAPDVDTVADVSAWFDDHEADTVAFGPFPPFWTDDVTIAMTGYVPRPDGTVHLAAY